MIDDWRRETAADVGYDWEREEARDAERYMEPTACRPGHHHMIPDGHGGGTCTWCNETITKGEIE